MDPMFSGVVGLFGGARYQSTDMYRSGQSCIMRNLGAPYCQVPGQAYVLKLYDGGWGSPSAGIKLIEPGSTTPAGAVIPLWYPASQSFKAEILQPLGGPPVDIRWSIDGVRDPLATTDAFTYTPVLTDLGRSFALQLSVRDTTSLVHPAMAGTSLESNHLWRVTVNAAPSVADVTGPATGAVFDNSAFTAYVNLTATLPITYFWHASAQSPVIATGGLSNTAVFTWLAPGQTAITVTAANPGGVVTATTTITVYEAIGGLAAANDGPTVLGADTMLSATTTSGTHVSYEWDFADGSKGSESLVSHTYTAVGMFTATVTATNAIGSETSSTLVTVVDEAITGLAAANNGPSVLGTATTLSATATSGTNVNYQWHFDDGSTASGPVVSHTYAKVGAYTATVTATNSVGSFAANTKVTIEPVTWFVYFPVVLASAESDRMPLAREAAPQQAIGRWRGLNWTWIHGSIYMWHLAK
jgi:PKD repeat protein